MEHANASWWGWWGAVSHGVQYLVGMVACQAWYLVGHGSRLGMVSGGVQYLVGHDI